MPQITIDRLALHLGGLTERDGQHLARLIAEGLAASDLPIQATSQIDRLRVRVAAEPGDGVDRVARQIVAEVLRQLDRTL